MLSTSPLLRMEGCRVDCRSRLCSVSHTRVVIVCVVCQAELERVKVEGRRRVEEARERGRAQYNDLVATIEKKYLMEFEESMRDIRAKAEADNKVRHGGRPALQPAHRCNGGGPTPFGTAVGRRRPAGTLWACVRLCCPPQACDALEVEIAKAQVSLKEAEARRAAIQLSEQGRLDAEEDRRKADIQTLQKKLLQAWSTKAASTGEILDFLKRLQSVCGLRTL
jgi:hypothetical protein